MEKEYFVKYGYAYKGEINGHEATRIIEANSAKEAVSKIEISYTNLRSFKTLDIKNL